MQLNMKTRLPCTKLKCGADAMLVPESVKVFAHPDAYPPYHGTAQYECIRGHKATFSMQEVDEWQE